MKTTPLKGSLPGEHIVRVEPSLATFVEDVGWQRRVNLFAGRALSDAALSREQTGRGGRLATRGQMVAPGVVAGLEVHLEPETTRDPASEQDVTRHYFRIGAGSGIAATGEDVHLPRAVRVNVAEVRVFAFKGGREESGRKVRVEPLDLEAMAAQPPGAQAGLKAAILLLVPLVRERLPPGDAHDPGEVDPSVDPYRDRQLIDASMPVLFAWPENWPMPRQDTRWRNRLVHMLLQHEQGRQPGRLAPWEEVGVPLALVGFSGQPATPSFVDRSAVVRPGGAPRGRTRALPGAGGPLVWQARVQQFAEQLDELRAAGAVTPKTLTQVFRHLPPLGVIPKEFLDYIGWSTSHLPPRFKLDAVPVPAEQLDAVVLAGASLRPLRTDAAERVRVLVPVPATHYEPRLLHAEFLDPAFLAAIREGLVRLGGWLARRQVVRGRLSLLLDALSGVRGGRFPAADPDEVDGERKYTPTTPATALAEASHGVDGGRVRAVFELLNAHFGDDGGAVKGSTVAMTSAACVAAGKPGTFEIVARAKGADIWHRRLVGDELSPEVTLMTKMGSAPALVTLLDGSVHVFARAPTGRLVHCAGAPVGQQLAWTKTEVLPNSPGGSTYRSGVAAVSRGGGHIDVFARRVDRSIWHVGRESPGQPWKEPVALGGDTMLTPIAVSSRPGWLEVFHKSTTGVLYMKVFNGLEWGKQWVEVPGFNPKHLTVVAAGDGRLDLFGVSSQDMWHRTYRDGAWLTPWTRIGGPVTLAPAVVSPRPGRFEVFARGLDGSLMYTRHDGQWSPFVSLGGTLLTAPAALLRGRDQVDVFYRGRGNAFWRRPDVYGDPWALVARSGLQGLVRALQARSDAVDDLIDGKFAQVQAEIHRVRQLMLGTVTASRLATSTALSTIAQAETRPAENVDVVGYAKRLSRTIWKPMAAEMHSPQLMHRLAKPPSQEVWEAAKVVKVEAVRDVAALLRRVPFRFRDAPIPRFMDETDEPMTWSQLLERDAAAAAALLEKHRDALVLTEDPDSSKVDESHYFSASIKLLEETIAMLRHFEEDVQRHARIIAACEATRGEVEALRGGAEARLAVIAGEITEARQDVTVARALLAEEQGRLDAVNERRAAVLRDHVKFLVFHRPRVHDLARTTPARALDPGAVADVLPDVLASPAAAPPALWPVIELFREAPLGWFAAGRALLRGLDRIEHLHAAVERARSRATQGVAPAAPAQATGRLAEGLARVLVAQRGALGGRRLAAGGLELAALRSRSWSELLEQTLGHITLGDLAEGGHGRPDVARAAALELERIARVATGLYSRFGEVSPALRLDWAESLSQYDATVRLRELARLPRWEQIEVGERREMQALVDWLFLRIDAGEPQAFALMNDLVRACMLLASHAPVNEIVAGHVPQPTVVQVGGTFDLAVSPARVRIGMHVLVQAAGHTVQAVVEDMSSGSARARVLTATAPSVTIAEKTAATFSDPGRGKGMLLPGTGVKR